MSLVYACGFGIGNTAEFAVTGGTFSADGALKRTGGYSLKTNPPSSGVGYARLSGYDSTGAKALTAFSVATAYISLYIYITTLPASGSNQFFRVINTTAGIKLQLSLNSDGTVTVINSLSASLGTTVDSLPTGQWVLLQVKCETGASADFDVRWDGVSRLSGTSNLSTINAGGILFGAGVGITATYTVNWADLVIDDAAFRDPTVETLIVNGAGNYTAFTNTYASCDEIPWGAADYAASQAPNDAQTYTVAASSNTGTPLGVVAKVFVVRAAAGSVHKLRFRSDTTDADTTALASPSAATEYGRVFATNPNGEGAWTLAAINASQVGAVEDSTSTNRVRLHAACLYAAFAATGAVNLTGTAAQTLMPFAQSGAAAEKFASAGAQALIHAVQSGAGLERLIGSGAQALIHVGQSGSGKLVIIATGADLLPLLKQTGAGDITTVSKVGSGAQALAHVIQSGAGAHPFVATGAAALQHIQQSGSGSRTIAGISGAAAQALSRLAQSGSAAAYFRGAGASRLAAMAQSGAGYEAIAAAAASMLGEMQQQASGFLPISTAAASWLASMAQAGIGEIDSSAVLFVPDERLIIVRAEDRMMVVSGEDRMIRVLH